MMKQRHSRSWYEARKVLQEANSESNYVVPFWAIQAIAKEPSESSLVLLLELLNHPNSLVRWSVVQHLSNWTSERSRIAKELETHLKHEENYTVRMLIYDALAHLMEPQKAWELFLQAIRSETVLEARYAASNALRQIAPHVHHQIFEQLLIETSPIVWLYLATSLETVPNIGTFLIQKLNEETDDFIKQRLCEALGYLKTQEAVPILVEYLLNQNASWLVRFKSAFALGLIGSEEALSGLIELLSNPDDKVDRALRHIIITAISSIGTSRAYQFFCEYQDLEPDSELRRLIIKEQIRLRELEQEQA